LVSPHPLRSRKLKGLVPSSSSSFPLLNVCPIAGRLLSSYNPLTTFLTTQLISP
jgi:hypothetical protein